MSKGRKLLWVDGVNSVVMAKRVLERHPDAIPMHCDMGASVDPDNERFLRDVESWYRKPIVRLRSTEFATIDEVFERRRYLSGPNGAPCTSAMKIIPRMNFQIPSDTHYWGYTADKNDAKRFGDMVGRYPLLLQRAPLIGDGLRKRDTHQILKEAGISRPVVYDRGLPNGNCIGCVKASGKGYWAIIRHYWPETFERRNRQARAFGAKIVILREEKDATGKRVNVRGYPDEVPLDQPLKVRGAFGGCGFLCGGDGDEN